MYRVLARKWRPQSFEELVGQQHIARALTNAIESERLAHAYIFAGVRGIGKTTVARVLAKCLNCEKGPTPIPCNECAPCREITDGRSLDVLELDAASRYPQYVMFQLTGDRCDSLDGFEPGHEVAVEFSLRGREWTSPKGEVRFFNSLEVWSVDRVGEGASAGAADPGSPGDDPPPPTDDDDIPF